MIVRPAKTQISLVIHPVWSEPSLSAWRKLGSLATHWAHSEDSDQTGRMPRLIWVFAGRICHFVGFVMRRLKCRFSHLQRAYGTPRPIPWIRLIHGIGRGVPNVATSRSVIYIHVLFWMQTAEETDQTPRSVSSDLNLRCVQTTLGANGLF